MATRTPEAPEPRLFDLLTRFITRADELLGYIASMQKRRDERDEEMLKVLREISSSLLLRPEPVPGLPGVPGVPGVAPTVAFPTLMQVIAKPEGSIRDNGSIVSGSMTETYQTIAKLKPTEGLKFNLAKIVVSCSEDILAKVRWQSKDLTPEYYIVGKAPFVEWFPWGYRTKDNKDIIGDGSELELQVKLPSGGTAADCFAEIVGEEG